MGNTFCKCKQAAKAWFDQKVPIHRCGPYVIDIEVITPHRIPGHLKPHLSDWKISQLEESKILPVRQATFGPLKLPVPGDICWPLALSLLCHVSSINLLIKCMIRSIVSKHNDNCSALLGSPTFIGYCRLGSSQFIDSLYLTTYF